MSGNRRRPLVVAVTGATGFVGGHAMATLVRAGHEVRVLVRDLDRLDEVVRSFGHDRPTAVVGDMGDSVAVRALLDGCDAVLHTASVVTLDRNRGAEMLEQNARGFETVTAGALELGVGRIVYTSSTSSLFRPGAGPLRADMAVSDSNQAYTRSKAACERRARDLQAAGAPLSIVYPSGILGPAAGSALGEASVQMARFIAAGVMPTRWASLSIVDVRDLADILVALLTRPDPPARVMCGGHVLTMEDLAVALRDLTGRRFPVLPTPPAVLRATGSAVDLLGRVLPMPAAMSHEAMALITTWAGTVDDQLAGLGVQLRPVDETLGDALAAWLEQGAVRPAHVGAGRTRIGRS